MNERPDDAVSTMDREQTQVTGEQSKPEQLSTADLASASKEQGLARSGEQHDASIARTQVEARPIAQAETAARSFSPLFSENEAGMARFLPL
jgi:hypothetical protein